MNKNKLPDKMSELIRVAIVDLEKVENLPEKYKVNMDIWHATLDQDEFCSVCLAGSVMAQTLGAKSTDNIRPYYSHLNVKKLIALNALRAGYVDSASRHMQYDKALNSLRFDRGITDYHTNAEQFKKEMLKLADDLQEAGY